MNNFITRLFDEIAQLIQVMATKMNLIQQNKEDKSNKKTDLSSTSDQHYPSVPAVNVGLTNTLQSAQTYTDSKILSNNGNFIPIIQKGAANGVAELDATGKVPANQLPSYVDDVVDIVNIVTTNPTSGMTIGNKYYNSTTKKIFTATSATVGVATDPESDKIYVNVSNNTTWRWSGSALVQMNAGLTLGETSTTAYRGDRGKIAYDHSQESGNPHNTQIGQIPGLTGELAGKSDVGHVHSVFSSTVNGFVPTPGSTGSVRYLREDGTWVTPANTTYSAMTLAQANAASSTTAMLIAPKVLNDWGYGTFVKTVELGDPTVGIPDWSAQLEQQLNF